MRQVKQHGHRTLARDNLSVSMGLLVDLQDHERAEPVVHLCSRLADWCRPHSHPPQPTPLGQY